MEILSIEGLSEFLKSDIFKLFPTQKKLCFPIIHRIHTKMKLGVPFDKLNVNGDLLINGHHRYICSLILKKDIETHPWLSSSKISVYRWPEIQIDPNDWESQEIIDRHNINDAAKSGLKINVFNNSV